MWRNRTRHGSTGVRALIALHPARSRTFGALGP